VVERVHERLEEMIATSELKPGSRLLQTQLAEQLGVSRTPIREALLQLEREGLVFTVPGRGMFVKSVTPTEILEIYAVRLLLEPYAARRACERATADDVARVQALQRQLEQPQTDMTQTLRVNAELHRALISACGNRVIIRILAGFWAQDQARRIYALQMSSNPPAVRQMEAEHAAITAAFGKRDAGRVEQLVREHIEGSVLLADRRVRVRPDTDSQEAAG
jgi:DNA-binding GntR family transcriptional regulator